MVSIPIICRGETEANYCTAPDIAPDIDEHGIHGQVIIIEQIKGVTFKQFEGAPLAPITPAAMLGVFLSLTLATLALMCSKWTAIVVSCEIFVISQTLCFLQTTCTNNYI